jgi:hypothetical protein
MRTLLTLLLAVAVAALAFMPIAWAADVHGKIRNVDPSGRMLTLEDGTRLTIPANVRVERKHLTPGADIKASFEDKGGEKIDTAIEVSPAQAK